PGGGGLRAALCAVLLGRRGGKPALLGRAVLAGGLEGPAVGAVATTRRAALVLVDGLRGVGVVRRVRLRRDVVRLRDLAVVALAPDADGRLAVFGVLLLSRRGRDLALLRL